MNGSDNKPANMPFDIPEDEDDEVFSSVLPSGAVPRMTPSSGLPSVTRTLAVQPLATLTVLSGSAPQTVNVEQSPFQVGRGRGDLELDDPYISPLHVQLRAVRSTLLLEDLNSRNGVFLRIADELALEDFDEIAIGHQRLIFRTSWDYPTHSNQPYQDNTLGMGGDAPVDALRLVGVLNSGAIARIYPITGRHTLGTEADFVVESDHAVSPQHALIERRAGKCFIKDLESEYGTFIRIHDPVELLEGDCFLVGRTRISVSY